MLGERLPAEPTPGRRGRRHRWLATLPEESERCGPSDAPSLHRYAYVRSNPLVFVDPTGRQSEQVEGSNPFLNWVNGLIADRTTFRTPSQLELRALSILRQLAGGESLFGVVTDEAEKLVPPAQLIEEDILLIDDKELENLKKRREQAGDALEVLRTIDDIAKAFGDDQQEMLEDSQPTVVAEGEDGSYFTEPIASLDPSNPRSGRVLEESSGSEAPSIAERMAAEGELTIRFPMSRDPQEEGATRELFSEVRLREQFPEARILRQRTIVDQEGRPILDPVTFEGRRLDFVVVDEQGDVVAIRETTSPTEAMRPRKLEQLEKTRRIRKSGPVFIIDPDTGAKIPLPAEVVEELMKEP